MLRKAWIIEDGVRYLIKSGYKNDTLQPFYEVLASEICERLGFNHAVYTLDIYEYFVVSKCPCFINKNTELITCDQMTNNINKQDSIVYYEEYIKLLRNNGIRKAREKVENMLIVDFLVMNEDRHLNNFGIIRNVNTLKWLDVSPIFDCGQSFSINYSNGDYFNISGEGRFFYEIKSFDEIIKVVKNIGRIDITKLDGIVEWFNNLLYEYKYITNYSDVEINRLCILLERQINKLKELIKKDISK